MTDAKPETSRWTKVIALGVVFIAGVLGYNQMSSYFGQRCYAKALEADQFTTVIETKWTLSGCQYRYKISYSEAEPEWIDDSYFETFHMKKPKS
jgi:hypothetical protein